MIRIAALALALGTVVTVPALASTSPTASAQATTTVYVAPDGSDDDPGTAARPLRTPQAGVDRLGSNGGTVVLAGGTYARQRIVLDDRDHVTVEAADGAHPVLDATGLAPRGDSALVEIHGGSDLTVRGLDLTGYRTTSQSAVPIGVLVTDGATDVSILDNRVHHLGNDNRTRGSFDTNAHGIAVYGNSAAHAITGLTISGNEVDHLVLGASEAVVVNGNVDGWTISDNRVHDDNNIGIDAIGYEPTIGGSQRYRDVNRARHGVIEGNVVTDIVSKGNPSYYEDGQWCNCADGIYVDGGRSIAVRDNTVRRADIGLEVAAENPKGKTNDIQVTGNDVSASKYVGLTIGGYAPGRGQAYGVKVTGNTFTGDNTLDDGSPEILLQYKVHETSITGNTVIATKGSYPLLVQRLKAAGTAAQNAHVTLDHNDYGAPRPASAPVFIWRGQEKTGLAAWRAASGQDAHSTYAAR